MKGSTFNIQHYSVHDGPGIRTVVFLKGCKMHCAWCANPESQRSAPDLSYQSQNCIGEECRRCLDVCEEGAISFEENHALIDWHRCTQCQKCVSVCMSEALKTFGTTQSIEDILAEVQEDRLFYGRSKGGLTLSGGEVCLQPGFAAALLSEAKERGINTAIETCGFAPWANLEVIAQHCDTIFFDIKHLDSDKHRRFTGVPNKLIIDNFLKLVQIFPQPAITVRTPVVPGFNDTNEEIDAIEHFLMTHAPNVHYELLQYHRFGESKYTCLGRPYPMGKVTLSDDRFIAFKDRLTIAGAVK